MQANRRQVLAALLTGGGLAAAGCAPSTNSPQPGPDTSGGSGSTAPGGGGGGTTTVNVWSWRTEDIEAYKKIFPKFEKANPGIKVEFKAHKNTEYNQILTTGLTGSEGPDVVQLRAYGGLQPLIEGGNLEVLDGKVDGLDKIDPNVLAGAKGKKDGKTYGVPFATQVCQVFYNKKIFKAQGVEVPRTWEDFTKACAKLKAAKVTPIALGAKDDWVLPIFHEVFGNAVYGGKTFQKDVKSGAKTFNDPTFVQSVKVVKDLQPYLPDNVVGVPYTDSQTLFTAEKAAMFPGGSFELAFFLKQNPALELGTFQVPPPPGAADPKPVSPAYADGSWGINAKAKHKDAALKLVKWMGSKEFGQAVADELKQFSPLDGVQFNDPVMKQIWDDYQKSNAAYLLLVDFRYGNPQGGQVFGPAVQELFLGKKDPAAVAAALQTGVGAWFKPGP